MRALIAKQPQIAQRIAVDEQKIGARAGLDDAEASFLTHDLRADERCLADDLDRAQHLSADEELTALLDLERAEQIAAVTDRHTGALAQLQRTLPRLEHAIVLREHLGGHPERRAALLHRRVGHEI